MKKKKINEAGNRCDRHRSPKHAWPKHYFNRECQQNDIEVEVDGGRISVSAGIWVHLPSQDVQGRLAVWDRSWTGYVRQGRGG
jgi:hypothetical protein